MKQEMRTALEQQEWITWRMFFFTVKINFNLSISYLTLKTACDYSIWYLTVRIRL